MTFTAASQIRRTANFVETTLDDEIVLLHVINGKFYSLKDTGRRTWELLEVHSRLGEVVEALLQEYAVSEEACLAELDPLLSDLVQLDLITVS